MSPSSEKKLRLRQGAFFLVLACMCGIVSERLAPVPPVWWLLVLAAASSAAVALVRAKRDATSTAALLAAVAALGAYSAALSTDPPADSIRRLLADEGPAASGAVLTFKGIVLDCLGEVDQFERISRYRLRLEAVRTLAGFRDASGTALLDAPSGITYGAAVEGAAFWRLPPAARVPGQFDYREYLFSTGVDALARARTQQSIVAARRPLRYLPGSLFAAVRRQLLERIEALGLKSPGVIPAVLLGDRSALDDAARDAFVRSGTMHLLAISGLHLAIVAGFLFWVLRLLGAQPKVASVVTLAVAACYIMVVGPRPPVVRAGLMLALFCLGVILDRPTLALSVVSTAALVMLVARPLEIADAGFQMSFVAVLGLFYLGAPLGRWSGGLVARARLPLTSFLTEAARLFGISTGAALSVAPLAAYHFKVISLVSPVSNLILIPVTWAMVAAGFAAAALSFVNGHLASLAAASASGSQTLLVSIAALLSKIPGAYVYLKPPLWLVFSAYACLVVLAVAVAAGRRLAPFLIAGLVAGNALVLAQFLPASRRSAELAALADSRGAAAVLFDGCGHTLLFVGRKADVRTAADLICPFLLERGVRRVDLLVETSGADARIRDALAERIHVGKALRQRRFRESGDTGPERDEPHPEEINPGDTVTGPDGLAVTFHSGRPANFLSPDEPWFEGLIAEVTVAHRRAVIAIDAGEGCIAVCGGKLERSPDLFCALSCNGSPEASSDLKRRLAPRAAVSFDAGAPPAGELSIPLGAGTAP